MCMDLSLYPGSAAGRTGCCKASFRRTPLASVIMLVGRPIMLQMICKGCSIQQVIACAVYM